MPPVFRWFFCAQKQKRVSLKWTNLAMSIYGIFALSLPRISFYSCIFLFSKCIPIFWWFFVKSILSWNGRNNSVSPVEKRRAFGFYRNNNSDHNRCELLTLEIHFLESVWSSIGNETWARSGIAIVVPMKISEGARSFSKQHKPPHCFSHSSRRLTQFLHKKYHQNITETVFMLRNKKVS